MDRTTTAKVVRGLVARGLVVRRPAPDDARTLVLALTAAGDRLREEAADRLERCDDDFLAPLPQAERDRRLASG